jgi:ribosomal protein L23
MKRVSIHRYSDDPICLRCSIGGWSDKGYYCTFRGDQTEVIKMLETVLIVLQNAPKIEIEEAISLTAATKPEGINLAMVMRCCAKAIHMLERNGLKRDAKAIRDDLAAFNIDVNIMPDPTIEGN